MDKFAVVIGSNYSTALGVIRSLGEGGYKVNLYYITSTKQGSAVAACSKYINSVTEHYDHNDGAIIDELISLYKSSQKMVIIPTDDYSSVLINRNQERLKNYFLIPFTARSEYTIEWLMNKKNQNSLAQKYGLRFAKSWELDYEETGYQIPEDIEYPCFIKPLASFNGGKIGMLKATNTTELEEALRSLHKDKRKINILIQQYLSIDEEYSISGVCLENKIIMPALLPKLIVSKFKPGVTIRGRVEAISVLGELQGKLVKMLEDTKYYGIFDLELFRCGDTYFFNEINFRSSSVLYVITDAGINLPVIFAESFDKACEHDVTEQLSTGKLFLSEKVAYDDLIAGFLSSKEYEQYFSQVDYHIIHNIHDPLPEKKFKKKMAITFWKRRIRKIIRK